MFSREESVRRFAQEHWEHLQGVIGRNVNPMLQRTDVK